jgi:hypothetical protein
MTPEYCAHLAKQKEALELQIDLLDQKIRAELFRMWDLAVGQMVTIDSCGRSAFIEDVIFPDRVKVRMAKKGGGPAANCRYFHILDVRPWMAPEIKGVMQL